MNLITAKEAKDRSFGYDRNAIDNFFDHLDCLIRTSSMLGDESVSIDIHSNELKNDLQKIINILTENGYQCSYQDSQDSHNIVYNSDCDCEISSESDKSPIKLTVKW